MNTRNKDWKTNSRGLFVFPSQCILAPDAISEHRRMTHSAISLVKFVQSLWSLTDFHVHLAASSSSPPVHNYWICYFTRPSTDVFTAALAIALYRDVVLDVAAKSHRKGIAQVRSSAIAEQTGKNLRGQVTIEMVIVFDPGGGTFYVPILEDKDGVLEAISKDITNSFICIAPLSVDNFDLHHLTSKVLNNFISTLIFIKKVVEIFGFSEKEPEPFRVKSVGALAG
ncbi:hypothetical protein RND71_030808 [Anisodus tanguticus]|uniref:Uncharacterized protein n=1 Tax=Anisodus tanguticus TaxID=243964 RepID=A0AAE1RH45_9SOLA|nr:hypothetical protein RND71_030808 [Anisodus tanguticus]